MQAMSRVSLITKTFFAMFLLITLAAASPMQAAAWGLGAAPINRASTMGKAVPGDQIPMGCSVDVDEQVQCANWENPQAVRAPTMVQKGASMSGKVVLPLEEDVDM